jgi:polyisoprenoid-binding protein YceI
MAMSFRPATDKKNPFYRSKSFNMTIKGTSTYHDWTSSVNNVSVQGDFVFANGTLENINHATVLVLTKSITSEQQSTLMDSRTHDALKVDKYPSITFEYSKVKSLIKESNHSRLEINGILTIAGTPRNTDLTMNISTNEKGEVLISGEKTIKMSDYGIQAPVFMLGLLRVGDEVTVSYDVVLDPKK